MARNRGCRDGISLLFDDLLPGGSGLLGMLRVFLDRGEKRAPDDDVMSVVATVFRRTRYKQFLRPWNRMLKRWRVDAFHATDFYNGAKPFERKTPAANKRFEQDCKQIPALIGMNAERIVTVAFRPNEFIAKASPWWKQNFGTNMHIMAVQICLLMNGLWIERENPTEQFAYICESGELYEGTLVDTINRLKNSGYSSLIRTSSFTLANKGVAHGLEASDFVAWHWNKFYLDRLRKGLEPRRDFRAFVEIAHQRNIVELAFLTGDKLSRFFSIFEKARRDRLARDANAKGKTAQ